jgi:adenosylmethionine-8-amino-7-oxononanoate aminotransferase
MRNIGIFRYARTHGKEQIKYMSYKEAARKYLWQFGTSLQKMKNTDGPLIFERGEGCHLFDTDGNRYIDGHSGVWVVNVGHGNAAICRAMFEQAQKLGYALSEEGYSNTKAVELAEKLADCSGGEMNRTYFTCGGSEAVEIALRMARIYHRLNGKPKKNKIIARRGSYHGATLLSLAVSGFDIFSKAIGPTPEGIVKTAHPYCFRCEYKKTYPECGCECADDLEKKIVAEGPGTVAAFIAEPVSTSSGLAIPPAAYWKKVKDICDAHNVLLIADEIVTGAGRSGTFFGMEQFGIWPDIVTLAKGITSGYSPLGAVMTSKRFTANIPDNAFLIPGFTFTSHPVACSAALANLAILEEQGLLEHATKMGDLLKVELGNRIGSHKHTGDIRGIGLMVCVELVRDRKTNESFSSDLGITDKLTDFFRKKGLYLRIVENYIHIAPPLVVDEATTMEIAKIVECGVSALGHEIRIDP